MAFGNVVNLRDVMPAGGAVDPNDPIVVAAGGTLIRAGSPKALVQKLQLLLASWGFSPGTPDGIYGTNTATAVRGLQAKLDLAQDGIFGPDTARAVQDDLGKGVGSVLRMNKSIFTTQPVPVFAQPKLPPAVVAATQPGVPPVARPGLPATQPAQGGGIPWWVWLGGAAAVLFLVFRTRSDLDETPLAPPGSVVADLSDDDDLVIGEIEEEEERPKKKRKPRRKKAHLAGVATPDEILPPEDAVDVEFSDVTEA